MLDIDPSARHDGAFMGTFARPVIRLPELAAAAPFRAFFSAIIMMASGLIVGFYAHPPAGWRASPQADQQAADGLAWGFTELPTLLVLGILSRSDARRSRTADRRTALVDIELDEYDTRLADLAARDEARQ